jgi:FkbM family methyltransferase
MTAVDAGAHYGYFTLLLIRAVGRRGHVISYEPNPENAELLRANAVLNRVGQRRLTVECAALGDRDVADVGLFAGREGASMEWTLSEEFANREGAPGVAPRTVRMASLATLLERRPQIGLIKMDIEGAEATALPHAVAALRRVRPAIVLEFHREVGWPALPALREAGYRLETLDGEPLAWPAGPETVPYQLVARPD